MVFYIIGRKEGNVSFNNALNTYSQTCLKQPVKGISKNGCLRQVAPYYRFTYIGILKCVLLCMLTSDVLDYTRQGFPSTPLTYNYKPLALVGARFSLF